MCIALDTKLYYNHSRRSKKLGLQKNIRRTKMGMINCIKWDIISDINCGHISIPSLCWKP